MDGLLVPLVTPFDEHGVVDAAALRGLAGDALDAGADGVVALATTGEPTALDDDERAVVLSVCGEVCAARGAGLVVGAGAPDTRTTLARHAALVDVPAVVASLVVTPYYVRPTETAIVAHLQHVAARSPVPVLAYNIPYRTGRGLGADALLDLAATDRIVGLKQAVGGIDADTVHLLAAAPPDFAVLAGDDPFLCGLVLLGARGGITASAALATGEFATMVADARAGRAVAARERAARLLPLVEALFAEPSPAVLKAVLHAQGRIATPEVRMPLAPASPAGRDRALAELAALDAGLAGLPLPTGWSASYTGLTSQ